MRGKIFAELRESPSGGEVAAGVSLFSMLIFTTSTAFVREAWAGQGFQIGIYMILAVCLIFGFRGGKVFRAVYWPTWLASLIPLWGVLQLVTHTTSSSFDTRREVFKWGALVSVFLLSQALTSYEVMRRYFFHAFVGFACFLSVLCVTQLPTSHGKVLWAFSTGYPDVYATFPNQNNYAQFIELALPIALWRAIREGWCAWWYPLAGAIMYASAIVSSSRAGAALCTAEVIAVLLIEGARSWRAEGRHLSRRAIAFALTVLALAAAFTFAIGWQRLSDRFQASVPDSTRRAFTVAGLKMVKDRPLTGHGLGTFPEVYQSYAVRTFPFYANHAHNDWVEFAADGGIPFFLLVLIPFVPIISSIGRRPAVIGLLAILLHACVDYPFPRPAVSGWIYALLGCVYATSNAPKIGQDKLAR